VSGAWKLPPAHFPPKQESRRIRPSPSPLRATPAAQIDLYCNQTPFLALTNYQGSLNLTGRTSATQQWIDRMTASYLFYDIETTGLNRAFDQVLQFAAIRTDLQFNEIDRRSIRIRLRPDVIPSPQAILTNRIATRDFSSGQSEYEAVAEIHGLMNQPGTISIGYNTTKCSGSRFTATFCRPTPISTRTAAAAWMSTRWRSCTGFTKKTCWTGRKSTRNRR